MPGGTLVVQGSAGRGWRPSASLFVGALAAATALALSGTPAAAGETYTLVDVGDPGSPDFNSPVHVDNAPGEPNLLFVVEQRGVVRVLDGEEEQERPFLDISDRVEDSAPEEGLLSIAFHPNYDENRRFFVYYTNKNAGHDIQVSQFRRSPSNPLHALKRSEEKVIVVQHDEASNHNGGQLQVGPDGYLYLAPGDGGGFPDGDPQNNAQSKDELLGKVLRIRPLSGGGYTSPDGNPHKGRPGRNEIWARGLRNPYRFSFDSQGGALTIGDVGAQLREEINYEPDGGRGANFGWNDYEGFVETSFLWTGANADPHDEPILDYPNGEGPDAVTGGYVIRDPGLPGLAGRYIYADFYDGDLRTLVPAEGGASGDAALGLNAGNVSSFGEGAGRQIYVADYRGNVFRLEQASP